MALLKLRRNIALLSAVTALCAVPTAASAQYKLKVVTDRKDAIYKTGEDATFLITVTKDGAAVSEGQVSFSVDHFIARAKPHSKGTKPLKGQPVKVTVSSAKPGFLRCVVGYVAPDKKRLRAIAGAAFSPEKIEPSLPVPDDFDAFWAAEKKKLAAVAPEPKLTKVAHADKSVACFDVLVRCLGGAPVSGYFAKPNNAKPKSLPAILWVHGAGVRSSSLGNAVTGAKAGMLSMDINAHGIPNGKPVAFYNGLRRGKLLNYPHAGRTSRDTIYFRGMFLRLVRAIDFLTSQPEWDGKTVAVIGHSQGGGQALVAGGIDSRVTIIAAGVPAICDHSGRVAGRVNGWPKLVPFDVAGKLDPRVLKAARYVDAVNFASRCRAEAVMSIGFIDSVCPPSSCYAAFNSLKGRKRALNEPLMGHAAPAHIRNAFFKQIREHAKRNSAATATR